jgi:cyclopropane-fatty-acyl-phospholipid synthase
MKIDCPGHIASTRTRLPCSFSVPIFSGLRHSDSGCVVMGLVFGPIGKPGEFMRRLFRGRIKQGTLTITEPSGFSETFAGAEPGPVAAISVLDPHLGWKILLNPELRFAEAYMDGAIEVAQGSLRDLLLLLRLNQRRLESGPVLAAWNRMFMALRRFHQNNPLARARANAEAHYDLGNDLYKLFLDQDMQYSCAYYPNGDETLEQAQLAKKRHIAAKLKLADGQRILEIGCGWGGLALYLAQVADVEVVGITLAREQLKLATERAEAAGLAGRVRFELMDYRQVSGTFDRVVSIAMLEAVGAPRLEEYFKTVGANLAPGGVAMVHSIMTKAPPGITGPFTRKYIFPGGYSPAMSETLSAIERSGLWLLDCEIWRKHYAYTLREWSRRFAKNREAAKELYDERFCRMWEFYLAGAETAFLADTLAVMHLQLGHEPDGLPLTRDYLAAETDRLRAKEAQAGIGAMAD